jgi:hypothetical protein
MIGNILNSVSYKAAQTQNVRFKKIQNFKFKFSFTIVTKQQWFDEFLVWNPDNYQNQTRLIADPNTIWTPDIVLFNTADVAYSNQRENYLVEIQADGHVTWMFPDIFKSYCNVDIQFFPFDK